MSYSLVSHGSAWSTDSNGFTTGGANAGGTASIDTTGADTLIVVVGCDNATFPTLTDSKSNTWTGLTISAGSGGTRQERIFYAKNATVGTGHTFTLSGTSNFVSMCFSAWSGGNTTAPFDQQQTGGASFGSTVQTGSVTPGSANELLVAGISHTQINSAADTIDSSFTVLDSITDTGFGHTNTGLAYQIQTTATTRNPTWTSSGGNDTLSASIATFKVASAAAQVTPPLLLVPTAVRFIK